MFCPKELCFAAAFALLNTHKKNNHVRQNKNKTKQNKKEEEKKNETWKQRAQKPESTSRNLSRHSIRDPMTKN